VRGAFYLTPADMEQLSFRDLYFFDNNYFRLNKIEDYDPINPSVNICEFLFLKSGPTFSATTGTVGGGGQQGSGQQTEFNPKNGANLPGKVIRDRGFQIGEFSDAGSGVMVGNILTNLGDRNAAFASSGVTFIGNDSIVIGEAPSRFVQSNEVWLQGHLMTQNNFSTNRVVNVTDNYTAGLYEDIIISTQTTNATISLPSAASAANKVYFIFKNTGAHSLTIDAAEGDSIDGNGDYVLNTHYECIQIVSDGSDWYVISKK
jgi:hypothetical protein